MPTGYTTDVCDGKVTELAPFIRGCARGFMLDLRDEPRDAPLPRESKAQDFSVKYHADKRAEALDEIHRLHGLTSAQSEAEAVAAYDAEMTAFQAREAKNTAIRLRYDDMLAKVKAWDCPPAMSNIKDFAIEQLTEAREFDAPGPNPKYYPMPERQSGPDWYAARIAELQRQVEYHSSESAKAADRREHWNGYYRVVCDEIERLERT